MGEGGRGTFPKVSAGYRRPTTDHTARHMQQQALQEKLRALTTIYAPRKRKTRKNKTAEHRKMLDDLPIKQTLSQFHPLPAIGQKANSKETVIVVDLKKPNPKVPSKLEVLKPLTPLKIHGYHRQLVSPDEDEERPQQLIRENTYDVIKPIFLKTPKVKKKRPSLVPEQRSDSADLDKTQDLDAQASIINDSPKTRFRNAAKQVVKLSSVPDMGKLLCLRERECFPLTLKDDEKNYKLEKLTCSPDKQQLNKISEIFQNLDLKGRQRVKKENFWF